MAVTSMAFGMSGVEKSAAKQIVSRNFFLSGACIGKLNALALSEEHAKHKSAKLPNM